MRLSVHAGGKVELTLPIGVSEESGRRFVAKRVGWLRKTIAKLEKVKPTSGLPKATRANYLANKEKARVLVLKKLAQWNTHYNIAYKRVAIRNTKTRWGSASTKGNLNFSYRIIFLPENIQDYLIVHELCHLKEHNHGKNFWILVRETILQYRKCRQELRNYR